MKLSEFLFFHDTRIEIDVTNTSRGLQFHARFPVVHFEEGDIKKPLFGTGPTTHHAISSLLDNWNGKVELDGAELFMNNQKHPKIPLELE
jgi:hypothetical protein